MAAALMARAVLADPHQIVALGLPKYLIVAPVPFIDPSVQSFLSRHIPPAVTLLVVFVAT